MAWSLDERRRIGDGQTDDQPIAPEVSYKVQLAHCDTVMAEVTGDVEVRSIGDRKATEDQREVCIDELQAFST